MTTTKIIATYTMGGISLEEANRRLAEAKAGFVIDPDRCKLTRDMIEHGWGLLDTGTGTLDKVRCENGHLVGCDCGDSYALYIIAGRTYQVKGTELVDPATED